MKALAPFVVLLLPAAAWADPPVYSDKQRLLVYREGGQERPVRDAAGWAKRREHILQNMVRVMGPLPAAAVKKPPLDVRVTEEVRTEKFVRKLLTYSADGEDRVPAYLFIPLGVKGKVPAVVCLHPTHVELGKKVAAGLGGKPDRGYAVQLAERGYVTIAPDYPNMGGYKYNAYRQGYASTTMKAILNHLRAVDLLCELPEVDADRIGAIGHSLGGHNSMFLAVFDERVKCVVSSCGFCSFPTYMKGNLKGWSHDGYMPRLRTEHGLDPKKVPFDFPEVVAALAPRAFLAVAPLRDHNFDVGGVKDCIAAARPVYRLLGAEEKLEAFYPDVDHNFPPECQKVAYEWLDRWLRR
jgi:fermentation-respiration switch protein FrsA (DUF1100 family)